MTAEWFTDDGRIAETSWGRFQDTPIFRSLAREHNVRITPGGWTVSGDGDRLLYNGETIYDISYRKDLLIQAIADGGYGG